MSIRRSLGLAAAVLLFAASDVLACPNCKDAVAEESRSGVQGVSLNGDAASGFNHAIYLALGSVFGIVGLLGFKVVSAVRRAERAQD
jgi:hypothetical protein